MRWLIVIFSCVAACSDPRARTYETITALEDGTALVVWRDRPGHAAIGRLDASGKLSWAAKLEGTPLGSLFTGRLLVTDSVVAVRTYRRKSSSTEALLEAFELAGGKRRWTTLLRDGPSDATIMLEFEAQFVGYSTQQSIRPYVRAEGRPGELLDIDPLTGYVRERVMLPVQRPAAAFQMEATTVVHGSYEHAVLDQKSVMRFDGVGCVIDGKYWHLLQVDKRWELTSLTDASRNYVLDAGADSHLRLDGCARYRESLVLFLQAGADLELRILDREGHILHRLHLGSLEDGNAGIAAAAGTLPRFLPLLVSDRLQGRRLVMIDLETGQFRWEAPTDHAFEHVFRDEHRWYWTWLAQGPRIVVLDGNTGLLERAVQVDAPWALPVDRHNLAGHSLWVLSTEPTKGQPTPVARLDARTLEVTTKTPGFASADLTNDTALQRIPRN